MKNLVTSIWQFYVDGFRSMTLGRTLWLIIAIKLFIMFFILRLFFFPNYLDEAAGEGDKEDYVIKEGGIPFPYLYLILYILYFNFILNIYSHA